MLLAVTSTAAERGACADAGPGELTTFILGVGESPGNSAVGRISAGPAAGAWPYATLSA